MVVVVSLACASAQPLGETGQSEPGQTETAKSVALSELVSVPARFAGQDVKVTGRFALEGSYFIAGKRKFFLVDDGGRRLEVTPWLPLSTPPPRGDEKPPATLADYLDKRVELRGIVRLNAERASEPALVRLDVKSARILSQ